MRRLPKRTYPDLTTYFDESGDTRDAFARRLNRSQSWLSKVENGNLEPGIRMALRICRLAGIPLESLAVHDADQNNIVNS